MAQPSSEQPQQQDGPIKITPEQLGMLAGDDYGGALEIDLAHLTAWDPAPIDAQAYQGPGREEACLETARAMTQALVTQLFQLPGEPIKGGRMAQLPAPKTPLPREKPLPKPKPPTRWEKFAAQKGIQKRKKESKLVWDEATQSWRRRHGYKKANDESEIPIVEAKPGEDTGTEDPFTQMAQGKKKRVENNKKSQLQNAKEAAQHGQLPPTLKLAAVGLGPGSGSNSKAAGPKALPKAKRKELQEEIKAASRMSGVSTASMGKFDKTLKGEKPGERNPLGKRRKFLPVTDTKAEHGQMTSLADRFLRERAEDVVDVQKAISKHEAAAREERRNDKEILYSKAAKKKGLVKDKGAGDKGKAGAEKGGKGGAKGGVAKKKGGKK